MTEHRPTSAQALAALDTRQLVANASVDLPRAAMTPHLRVGLWALRTLSLVLTAMVLLAFVLQLS